MQTATGLDGPTRMNQRQRDTIHRNVGTQLAGLAQLIGALRGPVWQDDALCPQTDPEAFHPKDGESQTGVAKKICRRCPVTSECLIAALDDYEYGIWGSSTWLERIQIRRAARRLQMTNRQFVEKAAPLQIPVIEVARIVLDNTEPPESESTGDGEDTPETVE